MDGLIFLIVALWCIGYPLYRGYVYFYRPAQWEAEQQRKHELELAKAEARKAQAGQIVGGIAGAAVKAVLGAVFKGRPHH